MKKIVIVMLSVVFAMSLVGCGSSVVSNEKAGDAVKKALEARWDLQDQPTYGVNYTPDGYGTLQIETAEAELEPLEKYRDAKFEDSATGEAFGKYLGILDEMKASGENYNGDFWTAYYNDLVYLKQRRLVLADLFELAGIDPEKEENPAYRQMMNPIYNDELTEDAEIVDEAFTVIDSKTDSGAAGFQVRNNTGYTFPEYAVVYRKFDADGNKTDSMLYAYIHEFKPGATEWTEDISANLEDGCYVEAFAYKAGLDPGEIGNMVEFDEPIVLKR
ncbi:MAG: hypothetical protein ACSW8G_04395 [Bacillota bacterium]